MNFLSGHKTYIVSGLMVLIGIVHFLTGDISLAQFISSPDFQLILNGFGFSFLRMGVKKVS